MPRAQGRNPIMVGVDPDPGRRAAHARAAAEGDRRRRSLLPVLAQNVPTPGYRPTGGWLSWEEWSEALHAMGNGVPKDAAVFAGSRHPQIPVSGLPAVGPLGRSLCERHVRASACTDRALTVHRHGARLQPRATA